MLVAGQELAVADEISTAQGFELVLRDQESGREKVLGTREFAKYYRQRYKPQEARNSVLAGQVVARYGGCKRATTRPWNLCCSAITTFIFLCIVVERSILLQH